MITWMVALAWAQAPSGGGFDAHGFRLAAHDADPRDPLVVARPGLFQAQSWFLGGLVEYASQPLVFRTPSGRVVELDDLVGANLSAGYAPHDRVRVDLAAPLYFHAMGADGPLGAGMGDLRASGMVALVAPHRDDGGLGLALIGNVDLPTGRAEAWLGQWTVAGGVGMAATWEGERVTVSGTASTQIRPNTALEDRPAPTRGGDALHWGAAVGLLVAEGTGLSLEVHSDSAVDPDVRTAVGIPVEALMSMKHVREGGAFLTAGVGAGLSRGAGAAPLRVLVGGGFGKVVEPFLDADGDGLDDAVDTCAQAPESVNGWKDDDGCPDVLPVLTLRVVGPDGAPLPDAILEAEGPMEARGSGSLTLSGAEVVPGTTFRVRGSAGPCLVADASVPVGETDAEIELMLQPNRTGQVRVEVIDPEGAPIPDAEVQIRAADPACGPDPARTGADGTAVLDAGPGDHFAFVSAPGRAIHRASFTLADAGTHTLRVTLDPTRIRVEATDIVILEKVFFDTNRATVQERSMPLLEEVAQAILANGITAVEIQGHTDDVGPADRNLALSQARAEAVRDVLVARGVPAGSLTAVGYGESRPVTASRTPDGRATNRRVEFRRPPVDAGEGKPVEVP